MIAALSMCTYLFWIKGTILLRDGSARFYMKFLSLSVAFIECLKLKIISIYLAFPDSFPHFLKIKILGTWVNVFKNGPRKFVKGSLKKTDFQIDTSNFLRAVFLKFYFTYWKEWCACSRSLKHYFIIWLYYQTLSVAYYTRFLSY